MSDWNVAGGMYWRNINGVDIAVWFYRDWLVTVSVGVECEGMRIARGARRRLTVDEALDAAPAIALLMLDAEIKARSVPASEHAKLSAAREALARGLQCDGGES